MDEIVKRNKYPEPKSQSSIVVNEEEEKNLNSISNVFVSNIFSNINGNNNLLNDKKNEKE